MDTKTLITKLINDAHALEQEGRYAEADVLDSTIRVVLSQAQVQQPGVFSGIEQTIQGIIKALQNAGPNAQKAVWQWMSGAGNIAAGPEKTLVNQPPSAPQQAASNGNR